MLVKWCEEESLMPKQRSLDLEAEPRLTLEEMREHHPLFYMRTRAAALLKIADGLSANWVAQHGLHKPVDVDQLYAWLTRYQTYGIAGLYIRKGRGRKRAFSPPQPQPS
jgi:hypothetical protein